MDSPAGFGSEPNFHFSLFPRRITKTRERRESPFRTCGRLNTDHRWRHRGGGGGEVEEEGRWHIVLGITWGLFQLSISILYHSCDYCIKFDSRLIFLRGQNTNHSNFVQRIIHFIKRPFLLPFAASEIRIEPFLTVCIKSVFQWISG